MDLLKEFFRDKSGARLLLIAAWVLLIVSQFFEYSNGGNGFMTFEPDFRGSTVYLDLSSKAGTGWELHKHAYVILVVLAFVLLREDIADTKWFSRFGYWAVLLLILAATVPGAPFQCNGAMMGFVALLIALAAALMNHFSRKSDPPPLAN